MSNVATLLDRALKLVGPSYGRIRDAWFDRRTTQRALNEEAERLREGADLIDLAASRLPLESKVKD